jgi:hypothetical protein
MVVASLPLVSALMYYYKVSGLLPEDLTLLLFLANKLKVVTVFTSKTKLLLNEASMQAEAIKLFNRDLSITGTNPKWFNTAYTIDDLKRRIKNVVLGQLLRCN